MEEFSWQFAPAPFDGCEDLGRYREGGFHPVIIGDRFAEDRYEVVHKLGSGGWATVWLAKDSKHDRYVALKILQAQCSEDSRELRMHQHGQANDQIRNKKPTLFLFSIISTSQDQTDATLHLSSKSPAQV